MVGAPASCDTPRRGEGALLGIRQRPLDSWPRRLRAALTGASARGRPPRSQRVYRVTLGGAHCKRVVFCDSAAASAAAARLQVFASDAVYPGVILERERELWVEWIEGERVERVDDAVVTALARLLGVLMKRAPRLVDLRDTPFLASLERDLAFLGRAGVLDAASARRLAGAARERAPARVWLGYDCTDAILKNFVWQTGGGLRAVDLESLGADQLLGWGPAKATTRWLGERRGDFLAELRGVGVPDFECYFDFVELCFRAFWQKSSLLEGKRKFVDPALFAPFPGAG